MTAHTTQLPTSTAAATAVVDLGAIAHNVRVLRERAGSADVMAVVKADGYGHGATPVARTAWPPVPPNSVSPPLTRRWLCAATASPRRCWLAAHAWDRLRAGTGGRRADRRVLGANSPRSSMRSRAPAAPATSR